MSGLFPVVAVRWRAGLASMCEWRLALRRRGRAGLPAAALCVSGGWHIGGLCGVFGLGIGLFAGVVVCQAVGFVPMCEWRLAHWGMLL